MIVKVTRSKSSKQLDRGKDLAGVKEGKEIEPLYRKMKTRKDTKVRKERMTEGKMMKLTGAQSQGGTLESDLMNLPREWSDRLVIVHQLL